MVFDLFFGAIDDDDCFGDEVAESLSVGVEEDEEGEWWDDEDDGFEEVSDEDGLYACAFALRVENAAGCDGFSEGDSPY